MIPLESTKKHVIFHLHHTDLLGKMESHGVHVYGPLASTEREILSP